VKFKVGDIIQWKSKREEWTGGGLQAFRYRVAENGLAYNIDPKLPNSFIDPSSTLSDYRLAVDFTPKAIDTKPDGGPAQYYDFPEGAVTLNDLIEFKDMDFHRGNIFKACWRWGEKSGTAKDYDARKIIYSGARLLKQLVGVKGLRDTLYNILDDPQFMEKNGND